MKWQPQALKRDEDAASSNARFTKGITLRQDDLQPLPTGAILVVEPDGDLCSRVSSQIICAGLSSISATNAEQALTVLGQRTDIALVFTAVNMPDARST